MPMFRKSRAPRYAPTLQEMKESIEPRKAYFKVDVSLKKNNVTAENLEEVIDRIKERVDTKEFDHVDISICRDH